MRHSEHLSQEERKMLEFERISLLFPKLKIGYAGMAFTVLLMGYFLNKFSSSELAVYWLCGMFISYLPRVLLSINYNYKLAHGKIDASNIKPWEDYLFYLSIPPFCIFSSMVFFPFGEFAFQGLMT